MLIGWPRMALLYFSSGIGGNLASAIFPELGPSGSHFGLLAALLVDLYHHRSIIENSGRGFVYYGLILCFLFLAGALPYVDNWAHIFGFIFGLLVTIITFPYLDFHEQEPSKSETSTTELLTPPYGQRMTPSTPTFAYGGVIVDINGTPESPGTLVDFYKAVKCLLATANRRTIAVFLSSVVLVALFLTLSYVFFANKEVDCPWCSYFNCINVFGWDHFCDNNGQELTKMLPI
ncbi:unnamed protein product [Caenorhabditis auriculariae]|uniref:Peptidase S54 rhomboid domain-containing protein n=1 Tax=Caenorhabditis auriculariae TaxID=2777116 RepID=A0A8S1HJ03_9PELO|nr:unnamed protein product [Caenorhabditis auriculariae]